MLKQEFKVPKSLKTTSIVLMMIGLLGLIIGAVVLLPGDALAQTQFWASLMHNAIFFLLIS